MLCLCSGFVIEEWGAGKGPVTQQRNRAFFWCLAVLARRYGQRHLRTAVEPDIFSVAGEHGCGGGSCRAGDSAWRSRGGRADGVKGDGGQIAYWHVRPG